MKKISLIVPCYNEENCLLAFDEKLSEVVGQMGDYEFEVFYINDGSKDHTLEIMRQICKKRDYACYLSFSRNFGKEAAMYAGFSNADGDYVAVMDADLQDPPELLPDMVKILESGEYDSVATRRIDRAGEPPIRSFFARMFYRLMRKNIQNRNHGRGQGLSADDPADGGRHSADAGCWRVSKLVIRVLARLMRENTKIKTKMP